MGYSTDIFSSEPAQGFICAICHDVADVSMLVVNKLHGIREQNVAPSVVEDGNGNAPQEHEDLQNRVAALRCGFFAFHGA